MLLDAALVQLLDIFNKFKGNILNEFCPKTRLYSQAS